MGAVSTSTTSTAGSMPESTTTKKKAVSTSTTSTTVTATVHCFGSSGTGCFSEHSSLVVVSFPMVSSRVLLVVVRNSVVLVATVRWEVLVLHLLHSSKLLLGCSPFVGYCDCGENCHEYDGYLHGRR